MQIQFDPRDPTACAAVLATIMALQPDLQVPGTLEITGEYDPVVGVRPDTGDLVHASEAFGDAADPAAAFPPATAAPTAAPAIPVTAAPAGTPGDGTAPTTPPVGSDNGQPAAPIASPSSPPAGVELDAKGLPWDGRIHAGTAAKPIKVGDGSWRKRRGVDDATVAAVEAQLRQVMAAPAPNAPAAAPVAASPEPAPAPAPTVAPTAPPPTPEPAAMASGPDVATTAPSAPPPAPPVAAAAPLPPVAAAVPLEPAPGADTPPVTAAPSPAAPAPTTPAAGEPLTLPVLMRKITALQTAGTLTVADTNAVAVSLGLTSVRDLVQRPDLIASFDALLPATA